MSAILHRRLHGHSSHQSSTSQHHQLRIHQLIKETMASIHDQLQCCLWIPRTNNKHQQHTHENQDGDRRSTVGVNTKPRPTVSANPHPPMEDKRVRQAKLSSASTTHSPKPYSWYQSFEHEYILMHHANSVSDKLCTRYTKLGTP